MARSKAYDEETVLTAAMHAFRRKGYGSVSIKALEHETGLTSGSIYNSFGDKDGLFRAALSHYNVAVVRGRIENYLTDAAGIRGLRRLFLSLLKEPDGGRNGCLLTNTAIEFGADDSIAKEGVLHGFDLLRDAFARVISKARERGAIDKTLKVEATALKLLAFYQGLLVLIRSGADTSGLSRLITSEFNQLEGGHGDA